MDYSVYYTLPSGKQIRKNGVFSFDADERENDLVKLYPKHTDQVWDGFGGAVTDSSAYVWSLMSPEQKDQVIDHYFSDEGTRYKYVRVPIDSCDFSLEPYEAASDGRPEHFDMRRPLKYILPMLEAIRARANIRLMLSPWSPPAVFKTNGQRQHGGKCNPEYRSDWAEYICRYIKEFEDRGFTVDRISLQNEPHAIQTWDSCVWSAEEERAFLINDLKPALIRHGFGNIEVYIWDHNKERILERADEVFSGDGRNCADGIAFHWYSGDHFEVLRKTHELFPEKKLLLSENCIEYSKFSAAEAQTGREMITHEIIGDLESGTNAFFDWNLVLDEKGGPNYVGNYCQAPLMFDTKAKQLNTQGSYYALWHFSHFITPGSKRILSSSCTSDIEKTAFLRSDNKIVLVMQNRSRPQTVCVWLAGKLAALDFPEKALATMLIEQ